MKPIRRSVWVANLVGIVTLAAMIALGLAIGVAVPVENRSLLITTDVAVVVVPAIVWLAILFARDPGAPEPRMLVLATVGLGAVLASGVGIPLVTDLFEYPRWGGSSLPVQLLGGILVVGIVHESLKYAAIRLVAFPSAHFDELSDGILYGTAAGIGYATVLNIHFAIDAGGAALGVTAAQVALITVAQASFGGVTGYFLARLKFEPRPLWWMPAGLGLAAVLNGGFAFVRSVAVSTSVDGRFPAAGPWVSLGLGAILAAASFVALEFLANRTARSEPAPPAASGLDGEP